MNMTAKKRTNNRKKGSAPGNARRITANKRSSFGRLVVLLALAIAAMFVALGKLLVKILPNGEQLAVFAKRPGVQRVGAALAVLVIAFVSLAAAKSHLEEQPKYVIDPSQLEIDTIHLSWLKENSRAQLTLSEEIKTSIQHRVAKLEPTSVFDNKLLPQIARAVEADPWVAEVTRVERRFPESTDNGIAPASIAIQVAIRKPVLLVEFGQLYHLIDRNGVVLPRSLEVNGEGSFATKGDAVLAKSMVGPMRRVDHLYTDIGDGHKPRVGEVWNNEQVKAALGIEHALREHKVETFYPVRLIDVLDVNPITGDYAISGQNWGARLQISFEDSFTEMVWGKAPTHAALHDTPIEKRIEALKQFAALYRDNGFKDPERKFIRLDEAGWK